MSIIAQKYNEDMVNDEEGIADKVESIRFIQPQFLHSTQIDPRTPSDSDLVQRVERQVQTFKKKTQSYRFINSSHSELLRYKSAFMTLYRNVQPQDNEEPVVYQEEDENSKYLDNSDNVSIQLMQSPKSQNTTKNHRSQFTQLTSNRQQCQNPYIVPFRSQQKLTTHTKIKYKWFDNGTVCWAVPIQQKIITTKSILKNRSVSYGPITYFGTVGSYKSFGESKSKKKVRFAKNR